MKSRVLIVVFSLFGLLFSCALPKQMQQEPKEDIFIEEVVEEEALPVYREGGGPPPIYIEGGVDGINRKELYANVHNSIKVYVEGENTEHLVVYSSTIGFSVVNAKKGLYSLYSRNTGNVVEVVAKDTVNGTVIAKVFDIVELPAPDASIGKYRTRFKNQHTFNAEELKQQNAVVLYHKTRVPVLCVAESYTLVRIDTTGKRSSHENKDMSGIFDEESKKMIDAATKGDVYIVQNIKSTCSPYPIKNIVYIIE